jgi:hypothetical protein
MFQRGIHAEDLGVRLGVDQARVAVTGETADALALAAVLLIQQYAKRHMKRRHAEPAEIVTQLLDARLMTDRRKRVRGARGRFGRIHAPLTVHLVELLGLGVVGFHILVADRPSRRDAAVVREFPEVFLAQAEQSGAVELRVATDVIVRVRVKFLAVFVAPQLLRLILALDVDGARAPVVLLARHVVAPLEDQNALAGAGQGIGERSTSGAGTYDDYVEMIRMGHLIPPRILLLLY